MLPYGSPNNTNVLTIDIPKQWEATIGSGAVGPNFWARTGCRYDITNNIAQCETGGCSGIYDCSKAQLGPPAGATLAEWTFYQNVPGTDVYLDHPDISAVNGVNLNLDIQQVGGSTSDPLNAKDLQWLAQNYPLTVHGADLRTPGLGLGQCLPGFRLKRSDLTGITTPPTPPGQAVYGFVIANDAGEPKGGNGVVACFSNCGRYEFPKAPAALPLATFLTPRAFYGRHSA
ncbi:MAG: thaumatin family protein [Methylocella sp.]